MTKNQKPSEAQTPVDPEKRMRSMSRRSLIQAALYAGAIGFGVFKLANSEQADGVPWPFRKGQETNEVIWSKALSAQRKVPTFSATQVTESRQNGDYGLSEDVDPEAWRLKIEGVHGRSEPVEVTLDQLKKMPQTEMITEFFCIEGWSVIQRWKGVRMADFAKVYPPMSTDKSVPDLTNGSNLVPYVGMETPDGEYFVGLDMKSALHDQTMLCLEMNGQPLTADHGAPVRLVIPVKYGVKNIKRIGVIRYTAERPKDYWAQEGYDWFAGV